MRIFAGLVCLAGFISFISPCVILAKVMWQDRKVPATHRDYARVIGGKKLVWVAMWSCLFVASCFFWSAVQWFKWR